MKETDIQRTVCDYLALKMKKGELLFWRQNNGGLYDVVNKRYRAMPKYSLPGIPDVIVIKDGWFIGLEIKVKGGRQSPGQKIFEKMCKDVGGEYYVITDVRQVVELGL